MMWNYQNGYYWGMHWGWWVLWILLLIWIFFIPYNIPGRRISRTEALDILKQRLARGEIDLKEYEEKKAVLLRK